MMARLLTGFFILAALFAAAPVHAQDGHADISDDVSFAGYVDLRLVAPPSEKAWLKGGISKFRYGGDTAVRFAEAIGQITWQIDPEISAVTVLRLEPEQRTGIDALETYLAWRPAMGGDFSFSAKAGAFFPTISLENDDLGWASPYTLTPSAINSWIGEELRTIGTEGIAQWNSGAFGTFGLTAAVTCCNDPAGIVMADRGWAMDDRPTGLLERVRLPDATLKLFHAPLPGRTGMFEEIDGSPGWYAGLSWQLPGIGKLTALRYDNQGNPYDFTGRDTAWDTRFYAFGLRSQYDQLVLIAQGLQGQTVVGGSFGKSYTFFQSAFLLASYDFDDWRISGRGEVFATRHPSSTAAATPSVMDEDGRAFTASLSWQKYDWLRVTGETIVMHSRRGEYALAAAPVALDQDQFQLSARIFY